MVGRKILQLKIRLFNETLQQYQLANLLSSKEHITLGRGKTEERKERKGCYASDFVLSLVFMKSESTDSFPWSIEIIFLDVCLRSDDVGVMKENSSAFFMCIFVADHFLY